MAVRDGQKIDGRSSDLELKWLTKLYGSEWENWRILAAEWLAQQEKSVSSKRYALTLFFETYLQGGAPWAASVCVFFEGYQGHHCSTTEYKKVLLQNTNCSDNTNLAVAMNYTADFLDWLLDTHFSEPNDHGVPVRFWKNPFQRVQVKNKLTETVKNPLPYPFILDLRQILCPHPHDGCFRDWSWAQQQFNKKTGNKAGDWFDVRADIIDSEDPDCVWRKKTVERNRKKLDVCQIWSPVRSMVLFIKLHLPLRTHQVRMLDSGEADTYRYDNGQWLINTKHIFVKGSSKKTFQKGVFRRIYDSMAGADSTGLYINTNKTADISKAELNQGYVIPWENKTVLYWLSKLRDWQEKYNPINQSTDCSKLSVKHVGHIKSEQQLQNMGSICFLFRDPTAPGEDSDKPINDGKAEPLWFNLLETFEGKLLAQGKTLSNGQPLKLVCDYPETYKSGKRATLFPLHSLRISLITAYALDGKVPLPVISKLLAGHSRLVMTVFYTKITPSIFNSKMSEAHQRIENNVGEAIKAFLHDAELSQIEAVTAYNDVQSIEATFANRTPVGWVSMHHGICLMGGNTSQFSESLGSVGGCWNGGEAVVKQGNSGVIHGPVPHGNPANCVRCRWFLTEGRYLFALVAHFNQLGYKAHQAANNAASLEAELEVLKDRQFEADANNTPFIKQQELNDLQRRFENETTEADEYVKDWIATFNLIARIMDIEEQRQQSDNSDKLIAVGDDSSVRHSIQFTETTSELLHLSLLCEDAEIYFDLNDSLTKTPAIEKRSRYLNRILMKQGFEPLFMEMSDQQQLIAGNAFMRAMAKMAEPGDKLAGFKQVVGYLESADYLLDNRLLKVGLDELTQGAMSLQSLCYGHNGILESRHDH